MASPHPTSLRKATLPSRGEVPAAGWRRGTCVIPGGTPVPTLEQSAADLSPLGLCFYAFSPREPVSTSLENALDLRHVARSLQPHRRFGRHRLTPDRFRA
ncbi:hypothetical protein CHELA40_11556 [Chelatococcus asaccharovorans]|nr:hypothetical protein CHELA40_11556 [Chelatococcus asaccharovorans]CAH1684531.1 hypothetical protein CHELA17_64046 [Chelatococcus asaccharovorans]